MALNFGLISTVILLLILLISFAYVLSISPYYGNEIFIFLTLLIVLSGYIFNLYFKIREPSFILFIFLIGGIAAQNREFTYIRVGPIYITEFIMIILMISVVARFILINRNSVVLDGKYIKILPGLIVIYFLFGLVYLIYSLLTLSKTSLFETLRNFSLVYYSLFSLIVYFLFRRHINEKLERFFEVILFLNTLRGFAVIFMYLFGLESFIPRDGGIIGGQPSLIFVFSSLISFNYAISKPNKRLLYLFLFIANLIFTFLSGHRSAFLALIVGLLTYLFLIKRTKPVLLILISIFLFGILLNLFQKTWFFVDVTARILGNVKELIHSRMYEPNANWRYMYWNNVMKEITAKPWGVGFDYSLTNLAPWEVGAERPSEIEFRFRSPNRLDPHNSYIAILARLGFIGFSIFALIVITYLHLVSKAIRSSIGHIKQYHILSFACFVAVAIFAAFNVTLEGPYNGIFFWIYIGINMAIFEQSKLIKL